MHKSAGSHSYTESLPSSRSSSYCLDDISQSSSLHPPSAKDLYMHRKEYADSINNQMTKSKFRVEHLFTCTLDGVQVSSLKDCVERLQMLAATDRVWGQAMVLELDDQNLLLKDKESEEELDRLSVTHVSEISSVMDSDIYDSLLLISVKEQQRSNVFMFQCDSVRADYIKRDLERFLQNIKNTNNSRGLYSAVVKERKKSPPPPEHTHPQPHPEEQSISDYDESPVQTPTSRREPPFFIDDTPFLPIQEPVSSRTPYTERERNVDILNHLINDIEEFLEVIPAVQKTEKKKKKKKKQKAVQRLPSAEEFTVCLQKIKMSFNLLAVLNNQIKAPSAAELTHCLFNILEVVVSHCPEGLPMTIVAPLLEPECVRFLSEEATKEEDELWQSLGDAWNIPSTQWPEDDEDIPIFTPVFNDGWIPPEISTPLKKPINRHNSQQSNKSQISSRSWQIPQSPDISEELPVSCMRVLHDFTGRNERELSVTKGEVLELLDISKRWWKVRNEQGEEGFVPNNVLKSTENDDTQEVESNPTLNRKSKPEEVRAWLERQGFSQITVRCLGGLSGGMLLGMKQDELKIVCPEEGRRVYYQLQNVKSALTLASDVRPLE